jgi:hypothetical protein
MATIDAAARPDHNSLGKAAFVIGLIGLVLSFIPIIGFVSWLLAPLAVLFGLIALRRPPRALAVAGIITGAISLLVCISWLKATQSVGQEMNKDTFNKSGDTAATQNAPIMGATIGGLAKEMDANKIAAGQKYGGHRLRFTGERINDFAGDSNKPEINFEGLREEYIVHLVSATFAPIDAGKIGAMKKGQKIDFVCSEAKEALGGGYYLEGCSLTPTP